MLTSFWYFFKIPLRLIFCAAVVKPYHQSVRTATNLGGAGVFGLGETHIVRGPLLIRKHHALDDLDAGKPALASSILQFLENDAVQLLVMHKIFQSVAFNTIVGGELLECWLGRHDDGNGFSFIFPGINTDIRNNRGGTVNGFKLNGTLVLEE